MTDGWTYRQGQILMLLTIIKGGGGHKKYTYIHREIYTRSMLEYSNALIQFVI